MYKTAGQIANDILVKIAAGGGTRLDIPSMFSLNAPQVPGRRLLDDSAYTTTGGRDLSAYNNRPGGSAAATVPAASPAVSTAAAAPRKHWSEGTMGNLKAQIAAAGNDPRRLALVQKWNKGVDLSRYGVGAPTPAQKAAPVVAAGPSAAHTPSAPTPWTQRTPQGVTLHNPAVASSTTRDSGVLRSLSTPVDRFTTPRELGHAIKQDARANRQPVAHVLRKEPSASAQSAFDSFMSRIGLNRGSRPIAATGKALENTGTAVANAYRNDRKLNDVPVQTAGFSN